MAASDTKISIVMKTYLGVTVFILTIAFSNSAFGQYISHYTEKDRIKIDTLIDKKSGAKFIIDKQRIFITAIGKNGKLLWKTDPAIDNKLEKYRTDRPTIVYFSFGDDRTKRKKEVIWLSYSNTQFGYLDKVSGKFTFYGQD
jgi:hypothetical protein